MKGFLVLDGPTGTELVARGFKPHPVLWTARAALDAPELLREIHDDYLEAGANIITANTFRTNSYASSKAGLSPADARKMAHASIAIATEAIESCEARDEKTFLAGSLAPLEDCYQPRLVPALETLERIHAETAGWLVEAGCQLILVETMGTAREALVAVRAARMAGADSVAASFITDPTGSRLLGGEDLLSAAQACVEAGAESILVNCVHAEPIEAALKALQSLRESGVVLGAYGNASQMLISERGEVTWRSDDRSVGERAREYAARAASWASVYGARIIGSCCGTTPEYIRQLSAALLKK